MFHCKNSLFFLIKYLQTEQFDMTVINNQFALYRYVWSLDDFVSWYNSTFISKPDQIVICCNWKRNTRLQQVVWIKLRIHVKKLMKYNFSKSILKKKYKYILTSLKESCVIIYKLCILQKKWNCLSLCLWLSLCPGKTLNKY